VGRVLTISPVAREAIRGIVTASDLPDGGGIRIATAVADPAAPQLELSLAPEPIESDEIVEEEGASVFLDSEVAPLLDDKVLDAEIEGDSVSFALVEQEEGPSLNGRPE
jgi:iron-sulfur cluster assembly protein